MKVIFLKNVPNVAQKDEIQDVKSGYARNYLIPNGLAKIVTPQDLEKVQQRKEKKKEKKEKEKEKKEKLSKNLEGRKFELEFKVGEEGQLFESVTSKKIAEALQDEGFEVEEKQINLDKPIDSVGEYPVDLNFGEELESKIIITITKSN